MNMPLLRRAFLAAITLYTTTLIPGDNFHFYRATNFLGEPRFEKKGLTSFDISIGAGSTCTARNALGNKTCLLNIYGPANIHMAGAGVPNKDLTDPIDIALTNLALIPSRGCFGQLSFSGKFSIVEANIWFTQNIVCGFFFQAHIPWRSMKITDVCFKDLSPTDAAFPNITTPAWQTVLNLFPAILAKYSVNISPCSEKGLGDTTLWLGWTYNYQQNPILDFIDATIKAGILIPTGACSNSNNVFCLPLGYNGHVGLPIQFDGSLGIFDWVTFGGHVGALFFNKKSQCLHMKTNNNQQGFIKLAQGIACIREGTIWHLGGYAKADHFFRGLSFLVGYTFVRQNADAITPQDKAVFDLSIVNNDQMFASWQMGTVHFLLDYDFSREERMYGPRIGIFYDRQVSGKRTFNTSMLGGIFGLDIAWKF